VLAGAAIAALWLIAAVASVVVLAGTPWSQDSEVRGQRFTSPPAAPSTDTPQRPRQATAVATVDDSGTISLTQTLVWSDSVPDSIELTHPDLTDVPGVPADVPAVLGRPEATLGGRPLSVSAGTDGGWRVLTSARGPGSVVLTYQVRDAVHRDQASPPGRALAVLPLPPLDTPPDEPRQLSLSADNVLNVSCPVPAPETVLLCAERQGGNWLVTVPPDGNVVLAQLDLPVPTGADAQG
jgi:hypothetical protein